MLETKNLTKNFKGLCAVNNLNLSIDDGEIVGIIGPNGAGKTTCFNLLSGFIRPSKGRIILNGRDITGLGPHSIAGLGIVRTFQLDRIFKDFSVLQNVLTASHLYARIGLLEAVFHTPGYRRKSDSAKERALTILGFLGLEEKQAEIARNLSHGHQKLLGIAISLAANPKILLLDEPLAGMNPSEVERALGIIAEIRKQGTGILLIEHNMKAVMNICDRLLVLNFGTEIARGLPEEIQQNKDVIQAYLGAGKYAT